MVRNIPGGRNTKYKISDFRNKSDMFEKERDVIRGRTETAVSKEIGSIHLESPLIRSVDFIPSVIDRL